MEFFYWIWILFFFPLLKALADWIGFYEFSNETNNLLVQTQNSALCSFEIIRNTQLCNNNFSPLIGNVTDHVNKVHYSSFQYMDFVCVCVCRLICSIFFFLYINFIAVNNSDTGYTCTGRRCNEAVISLWPVN